MRIKIGSSRPGTAAQQRRHGYRTAGESRDGDDEDQAITQAADAASAAGARPEHAARRKYGLLAPVGLNGDPSNAGVLVSGYRMVEIDNAAMETKEADSQCASLVRI